MAKLKKFKAQLSTLDIDARRAKQRASFEEKKEVRNEKFEKEKVYYNDKLVSMVDDTMSMISKDTTAEELAEYLKIGDKEWKKLCAVGRTRKISVPIDLYMQTMVTNLRHKKILTVEGENESNKNNEVSENVVENDSLKENQKEEEVSG